MQDELAETPAPDGSPQAGHKRKGDGNRKTVHNHKWMRIGDRVNVLSRAGSPDDLPASAHALPTASSNTQPQVASYQWSVARKLAAMPPPGQRRERRSYDAGANSRQPLATTPLRMASGIRDPFIIVMLTRLSTFFCSHNLAP
ncbi:hypothetical protein BC835DRAFT_1310686 [Cytidiella melzeri]|nr:hypothetical protein BC835DRAFT_1310686 [Cytidiella melzeri]